MNHPDLYIPQDNQTAQISDPYFFYDWNVEPPYISNNEVISTGYWEFSYQEEDGKTIIYRNPSRDEIQQRISEGKTEDSFSYTDSEGKIHYVGYDYYNEFIPKRVESIFRDIKENWGIISQESKSQGVDPFLVAAIIMSEQSDIKSASGEFGNISQGEYTQRIDSFLERRGIPKQLRELIILQMNEERTDILSTLVSDHKPSVGIGQINIGTAESYGLVTIAGRKVSNETPNFVTATLLNNESNSIKAVSKYLRIIIDTLTNLQKTGENWYYPDLEAIFGDVNPTFPFCDQRNPISFNPLSFLGSVYTSILPQQISDYHQNQLYNLWANISPNSAIAPNWGVTVWSYYWYLVYNADQLDEDALIRSTQILELHNNIQDSND